MDADSMDGDTGLRGRLDAPDTDETPQAITLKDLVDYVEAHFDGGLNQVILRMHDELPIVDVSVWLEMGKRLEVFLSDERAERSNFHGWLSQRRRYSELPRNDRNQQPPQPTGHRTTGPDWGVHRGPVTTCPICNLGDLHLNPGPEVGE